VEEEEEEEEAAARKVNPNTFRLEREYQR